MLYFYVDIPPTRRPGERHGQKKKEGVCCECQEINPLRPSNANPDGEDDLFARIPEDHEVEGWVMDTHEFCGSHCEGSGTMPQAVLND